MVKVSQDAFAVACFSGLSDVHEYSGHLQMAPYSLDMQIASCNSPHNWLMSEAMELLCVIFGGEDGTNGCYLAAFSEDLAFFLHFITTCLPPALLRRRSASGIGYTIKNYLKQWAVQLAIYSIVGD